MLPKVEGLCKRLDALSPWPTRLAQRPPPSRWHGSEPAQAWHRRAHAYAEKAARTPS
jgi:hypothetical protein